MMATILPLRRPGAPEPHSTPRQGVRLQLTRRGRALVTSAAFLLGMLVAVIALLFVDAPWALASTPEDSAPPTVTVSSGDTLSGYVEAYTPADADPEEFMSQLRQLNHLPTGRLTTGQEIQLPAGAAVER